jgi:hypothetical protein
VDSFVSILSFVSQFEIIQKSSCIGLVETEQNTNPFHDGCVAGVADPLFSTTIFQYLEGYVMSCWNQLGIEPQMIAECGTEMTLTPRIQGQSLTSNIIHTHVRMLENNNVDGILPMRLVRVDDKTVFHYPIAGLKPLTELLKQSRLTDRQWYGFIFAVKHILDSCKHYLLYNGQFLFHPDWVWVKDDIQSIQLAYVPLRTFATKNNLWEQWVYFIDTLRQFGFPYELYEKLLSYDATPNTFVHELWMDYLEQYTNYLNVPVTTTDNNENQSTEIQSTLSNTTHANRKMKLTIQSILHWAGLTTLCQKESQVLPPSGEALQQLAERTLLLSKTTKTAMLSNVSHQLPDSAYLEIMKDGEANVQKITLTNSTFHIGRESEAIFLQITHPAVSRKHLAFGISEGQYFVMDLNSTNGSYLNEQSMRKRELYPLHDGDRVQIPGMKLLFHHKDTCQVSFDEVNRYT